MGERQDCAVSTVITTCIALDEIFRPSLSAAMPQQTRFYGYNIIHDEQRDRLGAVAAPIATSLAGAGAILHTPYTRMSTYNGHLQWLPGYLLSPTYRAITQIIRFNDELAEGGKIIPMKTLPKDPRSVAATDVFPMIYRLSRNLTS